MLIERTSGSSCSCDQAMQQLRHDVKNKLYRQKVRHDIKSLS